MINVIKFTFKELIKNKSYKLTTLFLVAITIIAFNIPNISNYFVICNFLTNLFCATIKIIDICDVL